MIDKHNDVRPGDHMPLTAFAAHVSRRCGARFMSHHCDRFRDHPGQHVSGIMGEIKAVWIGGPGFVVRGLTRDSDQDAHAEYRSLLTPDNPDEPDEAGATLSREHVRAVLVNRLRDGEGDRDEDRRQRQVVNAILRELGLDEVEESHKIVTVEVKFKIGNRWSDETLRHLMADKVSERLHDPHGMTLESVDVTSVERVDGR